MKICSTCKQEKEDTEFYKKGKENRTNSKCKRCFNDYCMQRWTNRKLEAIRNFGGKCLDCSGEYHYSVFDFHHLDPSTKDVDWSKLRLRSDSAIKAELAKCVMLCANCHRMRHALSS